jgi:hypothetical protein
MVHYRIYTVGKDGHFTGPPEEVECADDNEVAATAMQMRTVSTLRFGTTNALSSGYRLASRAVPDGPPNKSDRRPGPAASLAAALLDVEGLRIVKYLPSGGALSRAAE